MMLRRIPETQKGRFLLKLADEKWSLPKWSITVVHDQQCATGNIVPTLPSSAAGSKSSRVIFTRMFGKPKTFWLNQQNQPSYRSVYLNLYEATINL